jgi:hypothetical protein
MASPIIDVEKLCYELTQRGDQWADADAAWRALDDVTKSVLSQCKGDYSGSDAATTTEALRDSRYRDHLAAVAAARKVANRTRVRYDTWKVYVELTRTNASTERALASLR